MYSSIYLLNQDKLINKFNDISGIVTNFKELELNSTFYENNTQTEY